MEEIHSQKETKIDEECYEIRKLCKEIENRVRRLMDHSIFSGEQEHLYQHSEMKSNIMLTVRHLEDARMRAGKIVQAFDGGKSAYSK